MAGQSHQKFREDSAVVTIFILQKQDKVNSTDLIVKKYIDYRKMFLTID